MRFYYCFFSGCNWQVRVIRGTETIRTERFGSPIVAMDEAKLWRAFYDQSVQASS